MKRHIKNVFRLPAIFLPLFAVTVLIIFLALLCCSVYTSCKNAINEINQTYNIDFTVKTKDRWDRVCNDDGTISVVNMNKKIIDTDILTIINSEQRLCDVEYITNPFYFSTRLLRTEEQVKEIEAHVSHGEAFSEKGESSIHEIGVIGCTDEHFLESTFKMLHADFDIVYVEGTFQNGVILPKELYDFYHSPKNLVIGWFISDGRGIEIDFDGEEYLPSDTLLSYFDELLTAPNAPKMRIPIAGYYTCSDLTNGPIICNIAIWEGIYAAQDYYQLEDGVQKYYSDDNNAIDKIGISQLNMQTEFPMETSDIMVSLINNGIDAQSFTIVADDYNYKFISSHVASTEYLSFIILIAVLVFGVAIILLMLFYAAKKRQNELYTLRTLGENRIRIAAGMGFEVSIVILAGVLAGIIAGEVLGSIICGSINRQILETVKASISNLSQISELMKDSDIIKLQMNSAVEAYMQSNIRLTYTVPQSVYFAIGFTWVLLSACAFLLFMRKSSHTLMRRGDQS